jgi:hypothetical protein
MAAVPFLDGPVCHSMACAWSRQHSGSISKMVQHAGKSHFRKHGKIIVCFLVTSVLCCLTTRAIFVSLYGCFPLAYSLA